MSSNCSVTRNVKGSEINKIKQQNMKPLSISLISISIIFGLMLESNITFSKSPKYLTQDTITGTWLGELEIPNTAKLRMGITISKTTDNSYKAVLNIIDQATGDIPCDEVIHKNDSVIIRINGLGIEVAGIIDSEHKSIMSEFRQHGGIFTIFFQSR